MIVYLVLLVAPYFSSLLGYTGLNIMTRTFYRTMLDSIQGISHQLSKEQLRRGPSLKYKVGRVREFSPTLVARSGLGRELRQKLNDFTKIFNL